MKKALTSLILVLGLASLGLAGGSAVASAHDACRSAECSSCPSCPAGCDVCCDDCPCCPGPCCAD